MVIFTTIILLISIICILLPMVVIERYPDIRHKYLIWIMIVWYARDLQKVLGYSQWRNFENAINRAKESIEVGSGGLNEHFAEVSKTQKSVNQYGEIELTVNDIELSRYACYLIAINGDTKKPEIAFAQAYFLSKARSYISLPVFLLSLGYLVIIL